MEERDYIYIFDNKGKKQKMELVLSFEVEKIRHVDINTII